MDLALASKTQACRRGIATVMPLYPALLHIAHRRDMDGRDPRELSRGVSVFAGYADSASRRLMERLLASLHLPESRVTDVDDIASLPDRPMVYMPVDPLGVQSLAKAARNIDRAVLLHPQSSPFIIPAGTYGALTPHPAVTLAVDKLLVARSGLSVTVITALSTRACASDRHGLPGDQRFSSACPEISIRPVPRLSCIRVPRTTCRATCRICMSVIRGSQRYL